MILLQNLNVFRSYWRETNSIITFEQLVFSKGNSQLDLETGIWTAGVAGNPVYINQSYFTVGMIK